MASSESPVSFVWDAGKFDEALKMVCYFEHSSVFSRNLHVTKNSHSFAGSQTLLASESKFNSTGNFNSTETVGDARRLLKPHSYHFPKTFKYEVTIHEICTSLISQIGDY